MLRVTINVTAYDPQVIDALKRLAPLRKSGVFTVEALKYFLRSEEGQGVLAEMVGPAKVLLSGRTNSSSLRGAGKDVLDGPGHNEVSDLSGTVQSGAALISPTKGGIDLDVIMGGGRR